MVRIKYLLILSLILIPTSCEVFRQAAGLKTFVECKFKLNTIEDITLAGVDAQKTKDYSQLSFTDVPNLSSIIAGGHLPLTFTLNMQVNNPNKKPAAVN